MPSYEDCIEPGHRLTPASPLDQEGEAERLAAFGKLTAGIAHEIRNPLNFVVNFSHLSLDLMDELGAALAPATTSLDTKARAEIEELFGLVQENLTRINQHGRRANTIVKTMLLHARHGQDNTRTAALNGLVSEAIDLARQDLDLLGSDRRVDFIASLSPDAGYIECFPEDLVRALFNLIINAAQAAYENRDQSRPAVDIAITALDDRVEIAIQDNGSGMEDEVLHQALTPFFTTKPPGEGTGLGLSLSHDVISRQHRGELAIASASGIGTRVTVTLFKNLPERRLGGRRRDDG